MAFRGQRPTPGAVRLARGTGGYGGKVAAGPVAGGRPVMPKCLRARAARIWNETVPHGPWLAECESHLLAVYCSLLAEHERDPKGMTAARLAQIRAYRRELGFGR
jgi:hypothetical protein